MRRYLIIAAVLLFALNFAVWFVYLTESSRQFLTISILDVGQGDAILIESPSGRQILLDTGPDISVIRSLSAQLSPYDKWIDMVITTHPDLDHIGGALDIFDRFKVRQYGIYPYSATSSLTTEIDSATQDRKINQIYLQAGDVIDLDEAIRIEVLWPSPKYQSDDKNNLSIVMRVTYGDIDFMFTGDAPSEVEEYLIREYSARLDVEVLKLGHHGSKTSTSQNFLEATTPEYVIVSAGEGNKFGHPAEEIISRVKKFDIDDAHIRKTTDGGSVVFQTDGESLWLVD